MMIETLAPVVTEEQPAEVCEVNQDISVAAGNVLTSESDETIVILPAVSNEERLAQQTEQLYRATLGGFVIHRMELRHTSNRPKASSRINTRW